jgi:small GTP-binding protein
VGKTSLVQRYVKGTFTPATTTSTIGASFLTKRALDVDSNSIVRLQVWDTAGQERFHSISKLYYRGASAIILVYSIIDEDSFKEMGRWLQEVKQNCAEDIIIHVVGTKSDIVAQDPSLRQVPFERCIAYVAENLHPELASTSPIPPGTPGGPPLSADNKRNSGFWGQDVGWDVCHEISASSGEGIEEVFRVITRKLVEQNSRQSERAQGPDDGAMPATDGGPASYSERPGTEPRGSFRIGIGDKRRSWLGFPTPTIAADEDPQTQGVAVKANRHKGRCC